MADTRVRIVKEMHIRSWYCLSLINNHNLQSLKSISNTCQLYLLLVQNLKKNSPKVYMQKGLADAIING